MAETAIGLLIDKLIPLLAEEAKLLRGVHKEVEAIKRELQSIHVFLKDADQRAEAEGENNDGVQLWVDELREVAIQIEDVIDNYTRDIAERRDQQKQDQSRLRRRFLCFVRKVSCSIAKLKPRHAIASKIQELKQEVKDINERGTTYGFSSAQLGSSSSKVAPRKTWSDPRDDSRFLRVDEAVGIQDDRKYLVAMLEAKAPQLKVIALLGMGGIGKTTLANQVYEQAKESFDFDAWIDVSQTHDDLEILRSLIKKFCQLRKEPVPEGVDQEMNFHDLAKRLRDYLQGKSYLITFDDVWDNSLWGHVKNAFPNGDGSSGRVVITTRKKEVADFCKISSSVHVHDMKLLSYENSMELFCSKAFHSEPGKKCPSELVEYSREIVERCRQLPLAIVVVGGLLATKDKTADEWRKLLTSLSSELENNEHLSSIRKILSLSYNDLPYNLKSCFLFLGIFPEDHSIRSRALVRQWIAEGFIKPQKHKTVEVVAEEYLVELINRSVVQVSKTDFDGRARTCRVHDLVRDFILKKMEDLKFCKVLSESDLDFRGLTARRISIFQSCYNAIETSNVRSVFVFDIEESDLLVTAMTKSFKLLRVLDFENALGLDHLPDDIGSLFHLRYLSLRRSKVEFLPKSIGKLENLETLDLKQTLVRELPVEINNLRKLRHLLVYHENRLDSNFFSKVGVKVKMDFGSLKKLQKLQQIDTDVEGVDILEELSKLTELQTLGLTNFRGEDGKALCHCIQKLKSLESFEVDSLGKDDDQPLDLESMLSPPKLLRRLYLVGRLKKFPGWVAKLENLIRILLFSSKLEDNPLEVLQSLPNLLALGLVKDAYRGENLRFRVGMFTKLKVIWLHDLRGLISLVIEEGSLPNLEDFKIGQCPQLKEIPTGFEHLKKLKYLLFREMPTHFLLSQNFQSIQSVPKVLFLHKLNGQNYVFPLSWVTEAQNSVPEQEKEVWLGLEFEQLYRAVVSAQANQ